MPRLSRPTLIGILALGLLSGLSACFEDVPNTPNPDLPSVAFKSQVFFSRSAGGSTQNSLEHELIASIDKAETSVYVFFPELLNLAVADALIRAKARGVEVNVSTNSSTADTPAFHKLRAASVLVRTGTRFYNGKLLLDQHRYALIDKRYVWLGGHSLSEATQNRDDVSALLLDLPSLAQDFLIHNQGKYNAAHVDFGAISSQSNPELSANYSFLTPRISTHDDIEYDLSLEIARARSSIKFLTNEITSASIAEQLAKQVDKGVRVQGVIEKDKAMQTGSQYSWLLGHRVDLRPDANAGVMNHNVVIIDDRTVLLGSYGMLPENQNSQQMMKIENDGPILSAYRGEFERIYALTQAVINPVP